MAKCGTRRRERVLDSRVYVGANGAVLRLTRKHDGYRLAIETDDGVTVKPFASAEAAEDWLRRECAQRTLVVERWV